MKKIYLRLAVMGFAVAALAIGSTGAFFSDLELSSGNTFTAGAIDLKIDNESYYNGAVSPETSWELVDLTIEKFFNFLDVKPGDVGEDTISLHVDTNDAYLCADVTLTSNDDNGITEPEGLVDTTDGPGEGELADNANFLWWADDGDNVLERCEDSEVEGCVPETVISSGPIGALTLNEPFKFPLADSETNIWTGVGGPVPGGETLYIGKAWCFGTIGEAPLPQDGLGADSPRRPDNSTGGISCDGSLLGNETQTDTLTADVSFHAIQSRHNGDFTCTQPATLTLVKVVENGNNSPVAPTTWTLAASGPTPLSGQTGNPEVTDVEVQPGTYDLSESGGPSNYIGSAWDCDGGVTIDNDTVDIAEGDSVTCTITNTFRQDTAQLTITKIVPPPEHGGNNVVSDFVLSARNNTTNVNYPATSSITIVVPVAPGGTVYTAREVGVGGYQATFGGDCNPSTHRVTLLPNDNKSCTITNRDLPANITLIKNVLPGGDAAPEDFELTVDTEIVPQNASVAVTSNTVHTIAEEPLDGYEFVSITGTGCPLSLPGNVTLNEGQAIICTITNQPVPGP